MGKEKVDLRIIKTRKAIKDAFLTLVRTKGYERITVQDIADEAIINRNTFYLHYADKYELMDKLCHEHVEQLNVCLGLEVKDIHEVDKAYFISSLKKMFSIIEDNIDFYKTMLMHTGQPNFSSHLKEAYKRFFLMGIGDYQNNQKLKVGLEYMLSGLVGVICLWVTDHENLLVEEIVEQLSEIHFPSIVDLITTL